MHFENREDYIRWATVQIFCAMDLRIDTNALHAAHEHAIKMADLFFNEQDSRSRRDPYREPAEVKPPPGVRTVNPAVPGQRTTVPQE